MIYVSIDKILYHKKELIEKLAQFTEMVCLLFFYTEVIRSALARMKGEAGKELLRSKQTETTHFWG